MTSTPNNRFTGRTALITGAARGQGRRHAVRLAQEGANIVAVDICRDVDTAAYPGATPADLQQTVDLVHAAGGDILSFEADVRDGARMMEVAELTHQAFGGIDIVSANAGIASFSSVLELDEAAWREMIDINLTGAWNTVRAAAPLMVAARRGGSIVLTGSVSGLMAFPNLVHYAAAKHGLLGMMKVLAVELAPADIRVNTICPTNVDTPMIHNPAMYDLFSGMPGAGAEQARAAMKSVHALPISWVDPDDVSNALLWLASDEARFITGVALPLDAGATFPYKLPHQN
jgi:SDR family mycofactocin-dependent oxidoreductase